jgi:hypothetical protein
VPAQLPELSQRAAEPQPQFGLLRLERPRERVSIITAMLEWLRLVKSDCHIADRLSGLIEPRDNEPLVAL